MPYVIKLKHTHKEDIYVNHSGNDYTTLDKARRFETISEADDNIVANNYADFEEVVEVTG